MPSEREMFKSWWRAWQAALPEKGGQRQQLLYHYTVAETRYDSAPFWIGPLPDKPWANLGNTEESPSFAEVCHSANDAGWRLIPQSIIAGEPGFMFDEAPYSSALFECIDFQRFADTNWWRILKIPRNSYEEDVASRWTEITHKRTPTELEKQARAAAFKALGVSS